VLKFEDKDLKGADEAFKAALKLAPEYANARYYLGRTYLAQDNVDVICALRVESEIGGHFFNECGLRVCVPLRKVCTVEASGDSEEW
jgi:hypothetical protein